MNIVVLSGRLTRDPEIKDLGGESRMARYTLAVNREYRTTGGDNVDFVSCVCFGKPAMNAEKYLKKGQLVCVRGWVRTGRYTNKEGRVVFTQDIQVDRADYAESRKSFEERSKAESSVDETGYDTYQAEMTSQPVEKIDERPTTNVENDFMTIPDDFDEDNIPFS